VPKNTFPALFRITGQRDWQNILKKISPPGQMSPSPVARGILTAAAFLENALMSADFANTFDAAYSWHLGRCPISRPGRHGAIGRTTRIISIDFSP
jgi:hypothetical protein